MNVVYFLFRLQFVLGQVTAEANDDLMCIKKNPQNSMDNGEPFLSDMQISVAGAQEHSIKAWTCCPLLPNPQFSILFCTLFHTSVCPLLQTPAALIVSDISLGFQMTINAFIQIPDTSTSYLVKKKKVSDRCGSGLTFFFFLPCRFILKR